ncbi:MAG: LacI family DNA-binding transcriptional regulator [Firmicutes bacterium]|nr:LacI family DNA-binding transcriptional regulator [Bacillota bacterium]
MVTIRDIARLAGVSYSTVAKALNDSPLVKPETKQRILEIAESQGYQQNLLAKHLATGRSRIVGIVLTDLGNPLFATMAHELERAFGVRGYHVMITASPQGVQLLSQLRVDGLIVWSDVLEKHPETVEYLHRRLVPSVILGSNNQQSLALPQIVFDRRAGIIEAVQYLKSMGHQRIGIIGNTNLQEIKVQAFLEVLSETSPQPQLFFPAELTWHGGYRAIHAAHWDREGPTALIGLNNLVTKGALRALIEQGIRVPEDMSLVGYDNLPDMECLEVPVTTVGPPLEEVARVASEFMLSWLKKDSGSTPPEPIRTIPPVLIARSSVCPPQSKVSLAK